jgi:hypothetical protein
MFDYTALISLVGFVALGFVPLYIPTVVTVVGGIRRWRENFVNRPSLNTRPRLQNLARIARAQ